MASGADGRWSPGIGDPTLRGWLTVGAYFVAALLALRAAWVIRKQTEPALRPSDRRRLFAFWCLTAVVLLLLGVNKQLDLQSWLTQVMRDLAKEQGWYEARHHYQVMFVVAVAAAGVVGTLAMAIWLRRVLFRVGIALLGLGVLGTFVVARAASFHHLDALLHSGPLALNWWAEFGGTSLVALNAVAAGKSRG
jgi:hypothetical protein